MIFAGEKRKNRYKDRPILLNSKKKIFRKKGILDRSESQIHVFFIKIIFLEFNCISKIVIIQNIFIFGIMEYTSMKSGKHLSFLLTLSLVLLMTAVIVPGVSAANATITGVVPSSGPITGLTNVTITGTNLTGASLVTFGGTSATNLLVVSATQINATTPAHAAGVVDVNITTPFNGTAVGTGLYTYNTPPTFVSILPSSGPITGSHERNHNRNEPYRGEPGNVWRYIGNQSPRCQRYPDQCDHTFPCSGGC